MKPKDINLNIYELTRLEKANCQKLIKKIEDNKRNFTQDELSYIQRMNQYNMFTEEQLKHIVAIFVSFAISKKI